MKLDRTARILAACMGAALSCSAAAQYQIVSNVSGTFIDVSGTGTMLPITGDDQSAPFTATHGNVILPAGTIHVSSNGTVNSVPFTAFTNTALPGTFGGNGYAVFWDDLYPPDGGRVFYENRPDRTIIQWNNIDHISTSGTATFQVQIFSSGPSLAQFIYPDVTFAAGFVGNNGGSATIGTVFPAGVLQFSNNTPSIQDGSVLSIIPISNDPGACCFNDGTCTFVSQVQCGNAGGTFTAFGTTCAQANCPTPRACCFFDGTCSLLIPSACTAQGGASVATATTCTAGLCPAPWAEVGDAGMLPAQAQVTVQSGASTTLVGIIGLLEGQGAVDVYKIRVCDYQNFAATTINGANFDTQLFLFREDGRGAIANDDAPGAFVSARINNSTNCLTANGDYYLAISAYDNDPTSGAGLIFPSIPPTTIFCASGPGAAQPVSGWSNVSGIVGGPYQIRMSGSCYAQGPQGCYANCDGSTAEPVLNVGDFTCFLQRYAAGESYANCDQSTAEPVLNVGDFTCFLQSYASGCP